MQKVTLTFPNHDSLWLFKGRSKAINVMIAPRKHMITGLFSSEEVENAVKEFNAIERDNVSTTIDSSSGKVAQTRILKPFFGSRVSQLLSLLHV